MYEDDYLLVINKEPGMVVHPSYGHYTGTLVNALAWHLKGNPLFKENDPRPGLVHRIDKDTSGLLVIAKTEEAKTKLSSQFFHKTSSRKYVAVCWGNLENDNGTIIGNIGRSISNRKIMGVFPEGSDYGKHAVTHYHVLERLGYVNVVECVLETGRTHQIRAHFKSIRHPLFNDPEYGGNELLKDIIFHIIQCKHRRCGGQQFFSHLRERNDGERRQKGQNEDQCRGNDQPVVGGGIHFFAKHQLVKRDRIDRLVATGQDILQSIVGSCHVQFISVFFMKKHHSVILSYFLSNVPVRRQCSV